MNEDAIALQLSEAREAYYNSETPLMTDAEFDAMEEELRRLNPAHSYFSTVGISSSGKKISHSIPMLSMGKAKTVEDVSKWQEKLKLPENTSWIIEPKIDGLSATCLYRKGKLIHVASRGDGQEGQDISHIAPYLKDIPPEIHFSNEELEIRGELYLPKNSSYDTQGKPLRNNCVGLINRKEDRADLHHVRFASYQMVAHDNSILPATEEEKIKLLEQEGFHTIEYSLLNNKTEMKEVYSHYLEKDRDRWLYETDGLIVMLNQCSLHEEIDSRWVVDHHHHYAIALKPPAASRETKLINVEWQISRLGSLIPVAQFEPVQLGGAQLERATLHNFQFAKDLQLIPGDTLIIERANDVIPYVRGNKSSRDREIKGFIHPLIPRSCPSCSSELVEEGVHLKCSNNQCPERKVQSILYWVRMSGMEQIAEATIRQLILRQRISGIGDIYRLKAEDFEALEGFGEKKINNFLAQTEQSRHLNAQDFISKLGIPLVQKKSLKKLNINSLEDFLGFNDDTYAIGRNIIQWKSVPENRQLVDELVNVLQISRKEDLQEAVEICMTGKGPMGRKELTNLLEDKGFLISSSVTQSTRLLLTDNPEGNSSKLQKARKQGTPIRSYEDFLNSDFRIT